MTRKYKKLINRAKKQAYLNPLSIKQDLEKKAKKMSKKMTAPERIFQSILKKYKIDFQPQFILGSKIFDFHLKESNTLVEIQGDYWHGNPEIYEQFSWAQTRTQKRDLEKKNMAIGRGFGYLEVWENDLNDNKKNVINSMIEKEIIKNKTI
jgi:very-short-patch-repair endonuclease